MHLGKWYLFGVMITAVVETDAERYLVFLVIKQRDAVHTATDNDYRIFHFYLFLYYPNNVLKASSTFLTGWSSILYLRLSKPLRL